ncbi:MAG: 50S ribosomal protein L24 [Candidatus Mariimomonas ferrooxydans]
MGLGIKKDDIVMLIAGVEKGKRGRVLTVYPKKQKVLIEKLNIIKRHMKPSKKYSQGGIIEKEAPIHRSKVILVCSKCNNPTRIGQKILESGSKVRTCRKCKEVLD